MKNSLFGMKRLFFLDLFKFEMEQDHPDAGTEVEGREHDEEISEKSPSGFADILDGEVGEQAA